MEDPHMHAPQPQDSCRHHLSGGHMRASDHDGISQQQGESCQHACRREAAHVHAERRSGLDVAVKSGSLVEVREAQRNVTRYFDAPEARHSQHANHPQVPCHLKAGMHRLSSVCAVHQLSWPRRLPCQPDMVCCSAKGASGAGHLLSQRSSSCLPGSLRAFPQVCLEQLLDHEHLVLAQPGSQHEHHIWVAAVMQDRDLRTCLFTFEGTVHQARLHRRCHSC